MMLPWAGAWVPHATLDLLRGCNISCPGCYNTRAAALKPLGQIEAELRQLLALRRLQAITLIGGEPTLHPQLVEVVRRAASHGVWVALLSNGVRLDATLIRDLQRAGLRRVYLHIQQGQRRPDIPELPSLEQLRDARAQKAELLARHGLQVGLSVMAYRSRLEELRAIIREVVASPVIDFLLVTEYTNFSRFVDVRGGLAKGLHGAIAPSFLGSDDPEEVRTEDIRRLMEQDGGHPFASLGSSADRDEPRWLLYRIGTLRAGTSRLRILNVRAGLSDGWLAQLVRWWTGRHSFFHVTHPMGFRAQLVCGALSGGSFRSTMAFVVASLRARRTLHDKQLLFQEGPTFAPDGRIIYCRDCPDATIRDGQLVPVCLTDRIGAPA